MEARAARAWGRRACAERERRGWREMKTPVYAPSLCFLRSSLAFLLVPDLEPQTLRHNSPVWHRQRSNCKTFRKLHRVAGRGLQGPAAGGGGVRLTQAVTHKPPALPPPSILLLSASVSCLQASATSAARRTPPPNLVGKGRSRGLGHPGRGHGVGEGSKALVLALLVLAVV